MGYAFGLPKRCRSLRPDSGGENIGSSVPLSNRHARRLCSTPTTHWLRTVEPPNHRASRTHPRTRTELDRARPDGVASRARMQVARKSPDERSPKTTEYPDVNRQIAKLCCRTLWSWTDVDEGPTGRFSRSGMDESERP